MYTYEDGIIRGIIMATATASLVYAVFAMTERRIYAWIEEHWHLLVCRLWWQRELSRLARARKR